MKNLEAQKKELQEALNQIQSKIDSLSCEDVILDADTLVKQAPAAVRKAISELNSYSPKSITTTIEDFKFEVGMYDLSDFIDCMDLAKSIKIGPEEFFINDFIGFITDNRWLKSMVEHDVCHAGVTLEDLPLTQWPANLLKYKEDIEQYINLRLNTIRVYLVSNKVKPTTGFIVDMIYG